MAISGLIMGIAIWFHNVHYETAYTKELLIRDVTLISSGSKKPAHVRLPYTRPGADNELLTFFITLDYPGYGNTVFNVVPDDCAAMLVVNRKMINFDDKMEAQRCNWRSGFNIDLKPYLKQGINKIIIVVRNNSGATGLKFSPVTEK